MNSKTKVTLSITAMAMVTLIAIVSIIAVFAARTQNFTTNITVKYTSSQIAAFVSAQYYVGPDDYSGTYMLTNDGVSGFEIEPDTSLKDATLNPIEDIVLDVEDEATGTPDKSWVVFAYAFISRPSTTDFAAKLTFKGTAENVKVSMMETAGETPRSEDFSKIASAVSTPSSFSSPLIVVKHAATDEEYSSENNAKVFYIKVEIDNKAKNSTFSGNFEWNLSYIQPTMDKVSLTTSGNHYILDTNSASTGDIILPGEYEGKQITEIAANAFEGKDIENLYIMDGNITTIGANAFNGCTKLAGLHIGESVVSIGESAFDGCSNLVGDIVLPQVETIGNNAFNNCAAIGNVTIGQSNSIAAGNITIGDNAFYGCSSILQLTIGENVTSFGDSAFASTSNLQTINYNAINATATSMSSGNGLFNSSGQGGLGISVVFGDKVTNIPARLFAIAGGSGVPNVIKVTFGERVESIGEGAFASSHLTELIIPNNIRTIEASAFYGCPNLTSIHIGSGVSSIGNLAFTRYSGNNKLTTIIVDNDNLKYTSRDNSGNELNCVIDKNTKTMIVASNQTTIPEDGSVTIIGSYAFSGSSMTTLTIPNCIEKIETRAFTNLAKLQTIYFNAENMADVELESTSSLFGTYTKRNLVVEIGEAVTRIPANFFRIDYFAYLSIKTAIVNSEAVYNALTGEGDSIAGGLLLGVKNGNGTLKVKADIVDGNEMPEYLQTNYTKGAAVDGYYTFTKIASD